jgi:hypothetical protein
MATAMTLDRQRRREDGTVTLVQPLTATLTVSG